MEPIARKPGDDIVGRYCPDLSPEERKAARERLERLVRLVIRIAKRLDAERAIPASDSREIDNHGTIPSLTIDV